MVTNSMERTFAIESVLGLEDGDVRVYLSGLSSLLKMRDEQSLFFQPRLFHGFPARSRTGRRVQDRCPEKHSLVTRW